jgi:hypothetical protein
MSHGIYRVVSFELLGGYRIKVRFDDGTERDIDLDAMLEGPLFGPLRDAKLFAGASLDPEAHTLVWPNGADFDPETLHDWPDYASDMAALAGRSAALHVAEPKCRYAAGKKKRR